MEGKHLWVSEKTPSIMQRGGKKVHKNRDKGRSAGPESDSGDKEFKPGTPSGPFHEREGVKPQNKKTF